MIFWRLGFCFFVRLLGFFILIYFLVFCFLFSYFVRFLSMFTCVYHPCLLFFLWANAFLFIILNLIRKGTYQLIWGFFFIFFFNENLKIMVFFIFFKNVHDWLFPNNYHFFSLWQSWYFFARKTIKIFIY